MDNTSDEAATHDSVAPKASDSAADNDMQLIEAASVFDLDRVIKLLAAGADAKYVSDPPGVWGSQDAKSALHMALHGSRSQHGDDRTKQILLALLAAGADPNAKRSKYDWRGCGHSESAFDMLLGSAFGTDPDVLEAFLAAGANANQRQVISRHSMRTDGETVSLPLHTAIRHADANVVGVLLRAGADPNAAYTEKYYNERGFNQDRSLSPLHLAFRRQAGKALDLVILLLAEGADPNAVATYLVQIDSGERGTTDDPRSAGFVSPVRCVPVRETALHCALLAKHPEAVRALLAAGADPAIPRLWDGESESTADLAARIDGKSEGELACALRSAVGWTPENHKFHSEKLREQVRTVLLVAKASNWSLPDDALFQIFAALAKAPGPAAKESASSS